MSIRKVSWSLLLGLLLSSSLSQAAIITTVAGGAGSDGTPASFGEGGPATAATLHQPSSVALDSSGNLYIVDIYNNRVRKVTAATGIITTVAGNGTAGFSGDGGQATTAQLSSPLGIALDSSGNLYIADSGNHRVRKVTAATGVITTVAGTGIQGFSGDAGPATTAKLNYPIGLAFDSSGNLYIADSGNNRVRKLKVTSGLIATVAGNGTQGFFGDGGLAAAARLYGPYGVALDSSNNLYIADTGNNRVRKVTIATGKISTVAGSSAQPGFSGDGGQATSAKLSQPRHIAVNSSGNLYIADTFNHRIRKVNVATGKITTIAGNGTAGFSGDGSQSTEAQLNYPANIAFDSISNLYIADPSNHRIRKVSARITTVAGTGTAGFSGDGGPATEARMIYPFYIAFDSSDNLYIADGNNARIRKVSAATGVITTVAGNGNWGPTGDETWGSSGDGGPATAATIGQAGGIALDSSGNLYIGGGSSDRVRKVTATTGIITTVAGIGIAGFSGNAGPATAAKLNHPIDLAFDSSGNLYIFDSLNLRVRKVTAATGVITTVAGNGTAGFSGDGGQATTAQLSSSLDIALDSSGNLYIADTDNRRIRKVTAATGIIITVAGTGTQGFSGDAGPATAAKLYRPNGLALDSSGNLYITDSHRVRKVTAATGIITTVAGGNGWGFSGDGGPATEAKLSFPYAIAFDSSGNLYIADGNRRVRKVDCGELW